MVSAMDEAVGNITEAFKQKGFWDNTLIIATNRNETKLAILQYSKRPSM
jgi:hypothetical protein